MKKFILLILACSLLAGVIVGVSSCKSDPNGDGVIDMEQSEESSESTTDSEPAGEESSENVTDDDLEDDSCPEDVANDIF